MEEKSIWRQKSGKASNSACLLRTKNWADETTGRPVQQAPLPMMLTSERLTEWLNRPLKAKRCK